MPKTGSYNGTGILFSEWNDYCRRWLANLFPGCEIEGRTIKHIKPDRLTGFRRVHLFAGIGGWEYALRLAGWPDDRPVWTGSCPCQPYSTAGKGKGIDDPRDLWPEMFRLVREHRPPTVFGEQVANAVGHGWLDRVFGDLEGIGYACGAADLPACGVGAPHIRQRIFWVADAIGQRSLPPESAAGTQPGVAGNPVPADAGRSRRVGNAEHDGEGPVRTVSDRAGTTKPLGMPGGGVYPPDFWGCGRPIPEGVGHPGGGAVPQPAADRAYRFLRCRDGYARRTEPGVFPLAHGVPDAVEQIKAYGNAIVPQAAAEFITAFLEAEEAGFRN